MESFEELEVCFGLGTEVLGESQDAIGSYPLEVIVQGGRGEESTMSFSCGTGGEEHDTVANKVI